MPYKFDKMRSKRKVVVKDLNPMLTCSLCEGYLIDATVLADCLHVFCRGCIIKYFDNCRTACPNCNIIYKKKNQICFRSDPILQALVYKLVPNLYSRELQTREDFYRSTGVRASSSCSDDSVIDKERDSLKDQEEMVTSNVGEKTDFFSTDDMISLSMEYYQEHLDDTPIESEKDTVRNTIVNSEASDNKSVEDNSETKGDTSRCENSEHSEPVKDTTNKIGDSSVMSEPSSDNKDVENSEEHRLDGKRYLKCPAAVSMQLLQKFVRMKYGLTLNHRVDIIYQGEVLADYFTLIDVAYTFKWQRTKPMRFFYRIFSPMKIKPIRIINTTSTSGSKQLQIVQVDDKPKPEKVEKVQEEVPEKPPTPKPEPPKSPAEDTEDQSFDKETLMANLQLQSTKKIKIKTPEKEKEKTSEKEAVCVYEYVEPDKEEIKRFAEKRDREWALQKKLDERNGEYYVSKKRKKSKHSKNESVHKKRKLHAEITSNEEEDLKLKVKITPHNSHKHKHHRSSQNYADKTYEISTKEKLLQMRQVRHKHVSSEDKTVQTVSTSNVNTTKQSIVDKIQEKIKLNKEKEFEKKKESDSKQVRFIETPETSDSSNEKKKEEIKSITINLVNNSKDGKKPSVKIVNKDVRPAIKEWGVTEKTVPVLKLERSDSEKQKTFLKSFQSYTEKYNIEKIKHNTMEAKRKQNLAKMSNAQPQYTIEPRKISTPPANTPKHEKVEDTTSKILHKYPPGFTVSKIEAGVKRKAENDGEMPDKRPSLEITLIPPTSQSQLVANRVAAEKVVQKRPLPSTIPLDRIRKSINLKSGISIIPKTPDVCDNIGALDLSNKSPDSSPKPATTITKNGINMMITNRNLGALKSMPNAEKSSNLSNLQMLSKVASEHPILNKLQQQAQNIAKSPRPNSLHSMNSTTIQTSTPTTSASLNPRPILPKMPELTEIKKTQFKMSGVGNIRSPRPNPNLNIRNIPNPSLLISKQTQNRQITVASNSEKESLSVVPSSVSSKANNIMEKQEIPV
ncbi:uncharacterized protein LOC123675803 [Harmonia axyridis]|uniref:uncharacterized protein LOC123675803 n=1 Tax=Harmonia axyridis TaxID=115357 RepID=UPI001E274F72|nr:uncharacterized protein LOC123675803 [Harmonia axyridis]